ncbi:Fpg/Nei family DNA glycosylase [Microbacterium sp. 1.5R]|uniref:Fpg/Nei family DNA glycosylase n=1 Tax=Microbacterium sp. 1.5R TaxID=1916917 RepID=UPI0011A171A4|nr:DNA-formamidopyrimidine glycosylase family protein [Microbacterium sp. 1.5R]
MPEGDSVFRLAARLRATLPGRTITRGELRSGRSAGASLAGLTIEGFATHGKHLLTRLAPDLTLHTHMRMQGRWTITGAGKTLPARTRHTVRMRAALDDGRTLWAIDMPVVELIPRAHESEVLRRLGPDPLQPHWDADEAGSRIRLRPDRPIAHALLDQRNVAGFGNLWVNEICFLRGVHPDTPAASVDVSALLARAASMLRISATDPKLYQVTTGDTAKGRSHWVAGRAGRPCLRCGTIVQVRAEVPGDPDRRRTWWCPRCQPPPDASREEPRGG